MDKMRKVAKDIIDAKPRDEIIDEILGVFFGIMRKHEIKKGERTQNPNRIIYDNPEWTMCETLFMEMLKDELDWRLLLGDIPDDLKC